MTIRQSAIDTSIPAVKVLLVDDDPDRAAEIRAALEAIGYRFVKVYPTDDHTTHFLHVERIEVHSPQSLNRRNQELNALAEEFGVESYDGMDVGPVSAG